MNIRNKTSIISGVALISAMAVSIYLSNSVIDDENVEIAQNSIDQSNSTKTLATEHRTQLEENVITIDTRYAGQPDQAALIKVEPISDYAHSSVYGELPTSLKGTAIPNLYVDQYGNLSIDKSVKHFFEYFLSAAREEGSTRVVARMQEYFSMVLDGPAHTQALELLEQYIGYRQQLDSVVSRDQVMANPTEQMTLLRETLDRRKALRRNALGEFAATAMFGDNEKYEDYAVNMMKTQLDKSLSYEAQNALIEQHEENLPEHIKTQVRHERQAKNLDKQIEKLKHEGGNEPEIYQLRKSFYGEPSANHWAFMEGQSDEWQNRVETFTQIKQTILASVMLNDEQKRQHINELRDRDFTQKEKMKIAWQSLQ